MIRTVNFTVDENLHVSPSAPQEAGVQGDDGATAVVFTLPPYEEGSGGFNYHLYDFYLEMTDAAGNYDITDVLSIINGGEVRYVLPGAWTECGGQVQLRLVAKSEGMVAYSFLAKIVIAKRAAAKLTLLPKFKDMIFTTIEKCKEAIASAKAAETASAAAASSAEKAAESEDWAEKCAADASGNRHVAEQSAAAAAASAVSAEQCAATAETAASNAESAKSAAQSAGLTVVGYLESTAGSKEAAAASAAAAEEKAASAAVSATDAAQYAEAAETASAAAASSATAAGQSAAAAAASAAGAAQSAAALENVGALTLIDSVTLTEAVGVYAVTLPADTYREVYMTAEIKLGGTISSNLMMLAVQEGQSSYRVCAASDTFSAGNTVYLLAHMLRLPARGTSGSISYAKSAYLGAKTCAAPGAGNVASATDYLFGCRLSITPQYTENTALMDVGTKIQLWGR